MAGEKIIAYAKEALKQGYPVDRIMSKLVAAGHRKEEMHEFVKTAVRHRISDLSLQRQALFTDPFHMMKK